MRYKKILNDKWKFCEGDFPDAQSLNVDDKSWHNIKVPHDWAINRALVHREADVQLSLNILEDDPKSTYASAQGFYDRWGVGWYRKKLDLNLEKNQVAYINFDGVFHESTVYLDGHEIGGRRYGYSAFCVPVKSGALAVRVDNSPEHAADRWYSGCGIYRPVTLTVCDRLHVKEWGITIVSEHITEHKADTTVKVDISNEYKLDKAAEIKVEILSPSGKLCAKETLQTIVSADSNAQVDFSLKVKTPEFWDITNPALYICKVSILKDGELVDSVEENFGIRKVEFIPKKGFYLNGRSVKIKGVNLHHDLGIMGAVWNKAIARDRLQKLKEIGCNAIRTAHNPPAAEFLDLCDEMGFLVMDEAFDKWDTLRYGEIFEECWMQDIDTMIARDKNHPSIIMWSVGNEVYHQAHDDMIERLKMLSDRVREKDSSRPVTFAMEPHCFDSKQIPLSHGEKAALTKKMYEHVDIISGNYNEQWYDAYHKLMPNALILGTETYPFYRGHGNTNEGYFPQNPWLDCDKDYVIGQFIWAGIDYLGEAVGCGGWPVRGWAGGLIDTAGQIKPKAHLTRSLWQEEPMVFMAICDDTLKNPMEPLFWSSPKWATGWNFEHLGVTAVRMNVFTNCESVEIRVNEASVITRYAKDFSGGYMEMFVPWQRGEVTAIGFNGNDEVCRQTYKTSKEPSKIQLHSHVLKEKDESEILRIEAKAVDKDGTICYGYDKKITFSFSDNLKLLGVDNGDLTDHTLYCDATRTMLHGSCVAFFKADDDGLKRVEVITEDSLAGDVSIHC